MSERKVTINNHVTPTHEAVRVTVFLDYLKRSPGVVVELTPTEASHLAISLLGGAETVRSRQKRKESYLNGTIAKINEGRGE